MGQIMGHIVCYVCISVYADTWVVINVQETIGLQ